MGKRSRAQRRGDSDSSSDSGSSDSSRDSSASRNHSPTPELGPNATQEALYRALRKQQSVANDARGEVKKMRRQLADVTNQTRPHKGHKKQKKSNYSLAPDTQIEQVRVLGRKFAVTEMFWLRNKKKAFTTAVDDEYNPLERFETEDSKMQGQLAALQQILPEDLRSKMEDMEKNGLADAFRSGMGDQRSNISTRVRRTAGPQIFDCTAQDLLSSQSRDTDELRRQVGWVADESVAGGGRYDPWAVELLYKNYAGAFDINTVFLGPKLHLAFAATVRGASAVPLLKAGSSPIVQAETNDQIWGLTHTTPGHIAGSAIAARFAVSMDDSLRENGTVTGINWANDYETYLKYLTTGLDKRKASVLKIFRVWDDIFFPGRGAGLGGRATDAEAPSVTDAMDALNADVEEEPNHGESGSEDEQ